MYKLKLYISGCRNALVESRRLTEWLKVDTRVDVHTESGYSSMWVP